MGRTRWKRKVLAVNAFTMVAVLTATYALLFALEHALPLRRSKTRLLPRIWVNAVVSVTAFMAAALFVRPATLGGLTLTEDSGSGLMRLAGVDGPAEIVASFLLMDLTFYYWHRANHRFGFLWRIHNVHHIDPDLDVTTGFRFHFGEVALSAVFRLAQILAIGPSAAAFAIYEVAFQTGTLFHHSNLRIHAVVERGLNLFLVTPRMHGIHHSDFRDETNSNFGVVIPWWDRLHRTLRLDVAQDSVNIGVPAYARQEDNRALRCLLLPFTAQRDYWRSRLSRL
jgi:sterol desaturase/sphingolipid hydroxylase (fatty acid hydroxylase superfamily)